MKYRDLFLQSSTTMAAITSIFSNTISPTHSRQPASVAWIHFEVILHKYQHETSVVQHFNIFLLNLLNLQVIPKPIPKYTVQSKLNNLHCLYVNSESHQWIQYRRQQYCHPIILNTKPTGHPVGNISAYYTKRYLTPN